MISEWLVLAFVAAFMASSYPYRLALPDYNYSFPRDYFEHADFRTEWWYYTGNVRAANGKRFGFELVFFRRAVRRGPSDNPSTWRIDDLYLAHVALTDIDGKRFLYYRRLNRAGPGIAGASFEKRRIWNGNWSATWHGENQTLEATASGIHFRLRLKPRKPGVIHGENGVSRKGAEPGLASHYISFTRLSVDGSINGLSVQGLAWMDHEWFTHQLATDQVGWDWFSIQLGNDTEFMLFQLRNKDDSIDPYSSGTYIDRQGHARHLTHDQFSLEPEEYWTSPKTKGRYPIRWRIRVPSFNTTLECTAVLPNQELAAEDADPSYWEGAVRYSGSASGAGYLEMTGYDKAIQF